MIAWETWIPQIVRYARLIEDGETLRLAWEENNYTNTSVTDFDEMYEQVFGDLASDEFLERLPQFVEVERERAIRDFLEGINTVDKARKDDASLMAPATLVASAHWDHLKAAAKTLIEAYSQSPYLA